MNIVLKNIYLENALDESGLIDISFTQSIDIVRREGDLDLVINIKPFWMMILFICIQCDA